MEVIVDGKRYNLDRLEMLVGEQPTQRHATGVTLLGVYRTRDGRVLVVTDSVWASGRNDGTTVGVTAHFADQAEIASLARRYDGPGGPLWALLPEGE